MGIRLVFGGRSREGAFFVLTLLSGSGWSKDWVRRSPIGVEDRLRGDDKVGPSLEVLVGNRIS